MIIPTVDVNIIYSVVQTGERTTDRGENSAPNIKRLCNGEYRPGQLHTIQSSSPRYHRCRCTCTMYKTAVLKMEESGKSSRGFRKKPPNCQRNNRNLQTSGKWEVCLSSMKVNWQPHVFHLHNKKEKKSVRCKSELQFTTKKKYSNSRVVRKKKFWTKKKPITKFKSQ